MTGARTDPEGVTVAGPRVAEPDMPASLVALVERAVRRRPHATAMRWLDPATHRWRSLTYEDLWDRVEATSLGLARLGIGPGDRVVVFSRSRPEWGVADLAVLALGAVTCPIFSAEGPMRIGEITRRIAARVAFVESAAEATLLAQADPAAAPERVFTFEPPPVLGGLVPFESLAASGASASQEQRECWEARWRAIGPQEVATVVHALGRGGELVGAVLTHGNILRNYAMVVPALRLSRHEMVLSVLPLSHMLERGTGLYVPLGLGATVAYAPPKLRQLGDALREIRPTAMVAVPLLLDRLADAIRADLRRLPPWQRRLVLRAIRLESRRRRGGPRTRLAAWLARRLVTVRVRAGLGGRLRFIACGGSALRPHVGRLLTALGVTVVEGYGLTETAPLVSLNDLAAPRFGTVGRPLSGTEVRIEPARGEILVRGPQVMQGYLDDPAATARALDADGWLHTGDLGRFDADGRLVITGVLKPLVVLATGKKVARRPIEAALRASPLIAEVAVGGDGEPELRAVVVPDGRGLRAAGLDGDERAVQRALEHEIGVRLAGWARYERPRIVEVRAPTEDGTAGRHPRPRRAAIETRAGG